MRHTNRLQLLPLTRGERERLSTGLERLGQFKPLGVIDMNLPYPHMIGSASYVNSATSPLAKYGILSSDGKIAYTADNPNGMRREYTYNRTLSGLSYDSFQTANVLRDSEFMGTSYWTQIGGSGLGTKAAIGPDGLTSAIRFTATANPATSTQNRGAVGAGNKRFTVWLRRVSGDGTCEIAANTASYSSVSITSSWQRFETTTTGQISASIRLTNQSQFSVIEIFAPTVTKLASYYGNSPEIIHSQGTDMTFEGGTMSIACPESGISAGTFVVECCTTRQASSDRLGSPFCLVQVSDITEEIYANFALTFSPSANQWSTTVGNSEDADFDLSNFSTTEIQRAAACWDASGARFSYGGDEVATYPRDLTGLVTSQLTMSASGIAIRYAALYDQVMDDRTLRELATRR
jgi:hypothetical protein